MGGEGEEPARSDDEVEYSEEDRDDDEGNEEDDDEEKEEEEASDGPERTDEGDAFERVEPGVAGAVVELPAELSRDKGASKEAGAPSLSFFAAADTDGGPM